MAGQGVARFQPDITEKAGGRISGVVGSQWRCVSNEARSSPGLPRGGLSRIEVPTGT